MVSLDNLLAQVIRTGTASANAFFVSYSYKHQKHFSELLFLQRLIWVDLTF